MIFLSDSAQSGEIYTSFYSDVAINGYDPVNYFTEGKVRKGSSEFAFRWKGADWHFLSEKHRDMFAADPDKYAPQYGGHCANGMSEGHKVSSDQKLWRIIDGKLYMFFAPRGRARWQDNTSQWIKDADRNWRTLRFE